MLVESNTGSRINPRSRINLEGLFNPIVESTGRFNKLPDLNQLSDSTNLQDPIKMKCRPENFASVVQFLRSIQLLRRFKITTQWGNNFAPAGQSLRIVRSSTKVQTYTPADKFLRSVEFVRRTNLAPRGNNSEVRAG